MFWDLRVIRTDHQKLAKKIARRESDSLIRLKNYFPASNDRDVMDGFSDVDNMSFIKMRKGH